MKCIRIISTFVVLIYISHLLDAVYAEWLKPDLEKMQGLGKTCYQVFLSLSKGTIGFALGVNLTRISNFIWDKKD